MGEGGGAAGREDSGGGGEEKIWGGKSGCVPVIVMVWPCPASCPFPIPARCFACLFCSRDLKSQQCLTSALKKEKVHTSDLLFALRFSVYEREPMVVVRRIRFRKVTFPHKRGDGC